MAEITELDICIIRNNMKTKSAKQLAGMLDIDVVYVELYLKRLAGECDIVTRQMEIDIRKASIVRPPKKIKPKAVTGRVPKQKSAGEVFHAERKKHLDRSKLHDRVVDYSQLKTLRIDSSTFIYLKPGEDAEEARRLYLERAEEKRKKIFSIH